MRQWRLNYVRLVLVKKANIIALICVAILLILAYLHDAVNPLLRFERSALLQHEYWRLFSAHIVHINLSHGLLNIAGFVVSMLIVGNLFKLWQWVVSLLFMFVFISCMLFFFSTDVEWYVGFSGALHGILMLGFLTYIFRNDFIFVLALLILVGKVVREQLPSFDVMHLHGMIQAPVVVDAHMYGVFAGTLLALAFLGHAKFKERRNALVKKA